MSEYESYTPPRRRNKLGSHISEIEWLRTLPAVHHIGEEDSTVATVVTDPRPPPLPPRPQRDDDSDLEDNARITDLGPPPDDASTVVENRVLCGTGTRNKKSKKKNVKVSNPGDCFVGNNNNSKPAAPLEIRNTQQKGNTKKYSGGGLFTCGVPRCNGGDDDNFDYSIRVEKDPPQTQTEPVLVPALKQKSKTGKNGKHPKKRSTGEEKDMHSKDDPHGVDGDEHPHHDSDETGSVKTPSVRFDESAYIPENKQAIPQPPTPCCACYCSIM
jgi:hypothetical protein